jgi:hypothetical protein
MRRFLGISDPKARSNHDLSVSLELIPGTKLSRGTLNPEYELGR